jgi:hypothetical protein
MSGILPTFVTGTTVADIQKQLQSAGKATDDSVRQCANIDQATRAAWGLFYVSLQDFVSQDPSFWGAGAQTDKAQALQKTLFDWQTRLSKTCALATPIEDPGPKPNPAVDQLVLVLKWTAVIVGVAGGAYAIGKLVELAPHPLLPEHHS